MVSILFLCVANSARSQMAEGLARELFKDKDVSISSAGTQPSTVHPCAIEALEEVGLDISKHRSKSVDEFLQSKVDWVITLCKEESCPVFNGPVKKLHWPMPDPAGSSDDKEQLRKNFRNVRDMIKKQLEEFKKELSDL